VLFKTTGSSREAKEFIGPACIAGRLDRTDCESASTHGTKSGSRERCDNNLSPARTTPLRSRPARRAKHMTLVKSSNRTGANGFTLIELMVATTILAILTMMALPLARVTIQREKEKQLRQELWEMRDAIDRYKEAADRQMFQTKVDSMGYPPDLETLVKGVEGQAGKKYRFLRSIPTDPMTHSKEWGLRSMQDDPDSDSWGGQSVFDVYTKSQGTGLDGTKYKDW
jgi:general secretion pathway protein G